ncbi:MAG: hypothetical protein GF419_02640 [Ignavibacteriales bacterium]|nr:hypothetical protein [Ignavibacteriales bacterium]
MTKRLEEEMAALKRTLEEAARALDEATTEDDRTRLEAILKVETLARRTLEAGERLKREHPESDLRLFHTELKTATKEVARKLDNIVESTNAEMNRVSARLKALNNQKKLANYLS